MGDCRNQPGDRIRQVEDKKAAVPLEYGKYPQYTQPAGSGKGDDHGDNGIIQASHASHQYVHQAAEKINRADDLHTHQAVPDYLRIGRIDLQQLITEENGQIAQNQPYGKDKRLACNQDFINPFLFIGSHILAGKA